jgi:hypothetical protein
MGHIGIGSCDSILGQYILRNGNAVCPILNYFLARALSEKLTIPIPSAA